MCHADRTAGQYGYCGCTAALKAARAGLHFFEEPFLSGSGPETEEKRRGSGTVFFTGCNLGCIYCQNHEITERDSFGVEISADRLAEIFLELQERGAYNINLVTGTPYIPHIARALASVRPRLTVPVVWNSSGYETIDSLRMLEGLVDIWLPDLKTLSPHLAMRYMNAQDYPEHAKTALEWMVNESGPARFCQIGEVSEADSDNGMCPDSEPAADPEYESEHMLMRRGVCVRHLMIPGQVEDSKRVMKYLYDSYGDRIWISLMSQYTPMRNDFTYPELNRKLTRMEYDEVVDYAIDLGIEQCMIQEEDVADESFIPAFDGSGIIQNV